MGLLSSHRRRNTEMSISTGQLNPQEANPSQAMSILLVDDEPDVLDVLTSMTLALGARATAAQSVARARDQLTKNPYDLCITDMLMPGETGLALIEYIALKHPGIAVAVLSAYVDPATAAAAYEAGAFSYLTKPINLTKLQHLMSSCPCS